MNVTKQRIRDLALGLTACGAIAIASACSSSSGGSPIVVVDGGTTEAGGRTCPGSTVQTIQYAVQGSCGDAGTITVGVTAAGSCTFAVSESVGVGLPLLGSFGDLAPQTGYDLAKGDWTLSNPTSGSTSVGVFLDCTSGGASSTGEITVTCEENVCSVGDTDDVQCESGGTCIAHLTPTTPDAG